MIVLDASVVIAHLSPMDTHREFATRMLESERAFLIHPINLAEVLVGPARMGKAEAVLADLRAIGIRAAPQAPDEPLRLASLRASTRLKLPDCCALTAALTARARLATFDDRLAQVARDHAVDVLGP